MTIHRPILQNVIEYLVFVIFVCNYAACHSGHLAVYLLVWFVAVPVLSVDSKLVQ